jgi:hypothetical protein
MNTRSASLLAASLAAIALALLIGGLVAQAYGGESVGADVLILPVVAAFPIVGVLIARRQPHNAIGMALPRHRPHDRDRPRGRRLVPC